MITTAPPRESTDEDLACEAHASYAKNVESLLTAVNSHVTDLLEKRKSEARNLFDVGVACTLLSQYEGGCTRVLSILSIILKI
jgi:hypothetical protein